MSIEKDKLAMIRKVIIVAPKVISESLNIRFARDWDTQILCESIGDLWQGLETGELSEVSEVILIVDALFNETPEEFIEAVAVLAPTMLVMVLSYNSKDETIGSRVRKFSHDKMVFGAPFYFIRPEAAFQEIEEAIYRYDRTSGEPTLAIKTVCSASNGLVFKETSSYGN